MKSRRKKKQKRESQEINRCKERRKKQGRKVGMKEREEVEKIEMKE